MYFEKYLSILFAIIFVNCICCESGVNEIHQRDTLEFLSSSGESLFLTNNEDSMLSLRNNTVWSADIKECKCKNGRCENTCAEWKEGACIRTKQVCVCDPEFGKYDDQTCIYCACGPGFNCTIDLKSRGDTRKCICPEGYYDYYGKCETFCSDSQPCLNGGKCQDGRCKCMSGTHGAFCAGIFWCAHECRPRLTVDCVYDQEKENYACLCKNRSLVFDYEEVLCKPCPCGEGTCREEIHKLRCDCKVGYKEHDRQCKKCDCGPNSDCELHYRTGEKICKCKKGYFEREGTCLPCECGHDKATCSLDPVGRKVCICPEGYQENLGLCEKKEENCTCHPTAICSETDGVFTCSCKKGYMSEDGYAKPKPGIPCIDVNECDFYFDDYSPLKNPECPKWLNQKCVNFPGSFMCQCETGYEPFREADEIGKIICQEYKVSWLPTGITIGVIIALIAATVGLIKYLNHRQSSTNAPGIELQRSR